MSYIFYVLGIIGLIGAVLIFVNGAGSPQPMSAGFSTIYAISAFIGAMGFLATGRILDHLAVIARNSRQLRYLELLDPQIAAERDAEIKEDERRRADRAERKLFGFGPKRTQG